MASFLAPWFSRKGALQDPANLTGVQTLTYAASVAIDFTPGKRAYQVITLAGDLTLTSANLGAGRAVQLVIVADGSLRNLTFPAGWRFVGSAVPATIAANKTATLSLVCTNASDVGADTDVVAAYRVQP